MPIDEMSKKEFKNYINKNWFFLNFNAKVLDKSTIIETEDNKWKVMSKVPKGENIMVFEGIASQNYWLWEKSRNWYKIDQNWWDFKAYKNNPIMLLQHDHTYWGIGHSINISQDENGNLINRFYIDLNTLDDKTRYQVENGFITAVSTSHISKEDMIEDNKTGERMTFADAWENGVNVWEVLRWISDTHTLVVTKAEMVENSLVTIWSNEWAIVWHNSVGSYFTNKYIENMKITKKQKDEMLKKKWLSKDMKEKINGLEEVVEKEVEDIEKEVVKKDVEEVKKEETPKETSEEVEKEEIKTPENGDKDMEENKETESENDEETKKESKWESENDSKIAENAMKLKENAFEEKIKSLENKLKISEDKVISMDNKITEVVANWETLAWIVNTIFTNVRSLENSLSNMVSTWVSNIVTRKEEKQSTQLTELINGMKN